MMTIIHLIFFRFTRKHLQMSRINIDLGQLEIRLGYVDNNSCNKYKQMMDIFLMLYHMVVILIDMYYWHLLAWNIKYYYACHLFTLSKFPSSCVYSYIPIGTYGKFIYD